MPPMKWKRSPGFLLPVALLALLLVLAWLQYRWTGELSRAEAERLRSGLRSSLARFDGELDFELARVLRAFSMRFPSELPEAIEEFRRESHYPEIVSDVYRLSFDDGKLELGKLESDGTFSPSAAPPGLARFRERAEELRNPHRGRPRGPGPPPPAPLTLVSGDPLSIVVPARFEPGASSPSAVMVVLRNDVIAKRLLPDITARVFGTEESLEFDVVVTGEADEVLFSSRDNAREVIQSADASSRLLSLRGPGRPRPGRGHWPRPDESHPPPSPPPHREE